jgi:transposase
VLKASRRRYPFVARVFADGGDAGQLMQRAEKKAHITLAIVKRRPGSQGFEVLPRRWVVERSLACLVKNPRFARDYEQLASVAETLITIAATATLLRQWL